MRALRLVPLALLALTACATPPLCRLGPEVVPAGASIDSLERRIFEQLLLAPATAEDSDAMHACTGEPTAYPDLPASCLEHETPGDVLPASAVGPDDLLVEPAEGEFWLAFLPVRRYSRGMSEGPIAIVRRNDDEIEVRALGVLRVYPQRIGLRLERVGEDVLLFADGELCTEGSSACVRSTRLLILVGQRLEVPHVSTSGAPCVGPALFLRNESRTVRIDARVENIFDRTLGFDVVDGRIEMSEEIVVTERVDGATQTRVVRRSDAMITMVVDAARSRLIADGTSRWSSLLLDASELESH